MNKQTEKADNLKNEEDVQRKASSITEIITGGNDMNAVCMRTMAAAMVVVFSQVCTDDETRATLYNGLEQYRNSISIPDFFIQSNLKDGTIASLVQSPPLMLYFRTLQAVFLPSVLSTLGLDYVELVDKYFKCNSHLIPASQHLSVLPEKIYLEQKFDGGVSIEVLKSNPLLFVVYFFRLAHPYSVLDASAKPTA